MSLSVKNLNGDTTFLLTFAPSPAPDRARDKFPGAYTILIDPWLTGPSSVWNTRFQISHHTSVPSVASLQHLAEPSAILISQAKPDHCHRATLCTLPKDSRIPIIAVPAAARLIRSWGHFTQPNLVVLRSYSPNGADNVYRIRLDPYTSNTAPGEVTLSFIPEKYDMTGLHNAVGITYLAPGTSFINKTGVRIDLPMSPPITPTASRSGTDAQPLSRKAEGAFAQPNENAASDMPDSPMAGQLSPVHSPSAPAKPADRPISVLYTPHGMSYATLRPYINLHLVPLDALPLTALFHSITVEQNPRIMGGLVARGFPGGYELLKETGARYWISAHDEAKDNKGWATVWIKSRPYTVAEAQGILDEHSAAHGKLLGSGPATRVLELQAGQEMKTY